MKAGDHLRVLRGGAWDHAIDLGDRTALRFAPGLGVSRVRLTDLLAGAQRVEVVVHRERTFRPQQVVARAFSRLGSSFAAMFATPEQFAVWCKSDRIPAAPPAAPPAPRVEGTARPRPAARKRLRKGASPAARPRRSAARKAPRKAARKARAASARKAPSPRAPARKPARRKSRPTAPPRRVARRRRASR